VDNQTVLIDNVDAIRILTLNRPKRLNALNDNMRDELMSALFEAQTDNSVAGMVITGAGNALSAGADIERFKAAASNKNKNSFKNIVRFVRAFSDFSKPLIAAINGYAVGWGLTMPLMCDVRLCSENAIFSCGFVRIGVTPEFGSSNLLPRIIGLGRAMEMVLTARQVTATEAFDMGLVTQVTPQDKLMGNALEMAVKITSFPEPAVRLSKAVIRHGSQSTLDQTLGPESEYFKHAMATPEHLDAVKKMAAGFNRP